ncbi:Hypothetical protein I595_1724 [Croceitalea dokdonensis DOKDO 023]|uniref:NRDE family protein n=1 Tax=Croceitalea dokdonensis DOKDO 023 TaxID=1300341 RepID=A0A0P7AZQ4_9FLAO|nr:Hypothetical protein I595_1724 [Croceitalea dokdonensis DOKDO 023]
MCTVSYVPLDVGYVLTSNRDENPARQTKVPNRIHLKNGTVIYSPLDVLKGGSWIATDEDGRTACLLNGAFLKHKPELTYRKSRGQIVLDAFNAKDFNTYVKSIFLEGIEPFTLLLIEPHGIQKLVWDGVQKHIDRPSVNEYHLWSSVTLYNSDEHGKKEAYFFEEMSRSGSSIEQILQVHGKDKVTPFILNHSTLQTVSITQVIYNGQKSSLKYVLKDNTNETSNSLSLICS